jgi:hypothetical protein
VPTIGSPKQYLLVAVCQGQFTGIHPIPTSKNEYLQTGDTMIVCVHTRVNSGSAAAVVQALFGVAAHAHQWCLTYMLLSFLTACREAEGGCDVPKVCTAEGRCPADELKQSGTLCR